MPAPSIPDIVNALTATNQHWTTSQITFSIPKAGSAWPGYPHYGADWHQYYGNEPWDPLYSVLSPSQADEFRAIIASYDRIIAPHIVETDDLTQPGQIRIAFQNIEGLHDGYAYLPPYVGQAEAPMDGDIWIDARLSAGSLRPGNGLNQSPLPNAAHEVGHTLGLKHPFEGGATLPDDYDNYRYSIMAYGWHPGREVLSFAAGTGPNPIMMFRGDWTTPEGPMVFDIAALQAIYGADPDTESGATTYRLTEGRPFLTAIYDAGGIDTIDLSTHARASIVDLTPGAYSSIDIYTRDQQYADWSAKLPAYATRIAEELDNSVAHGSLYTGHDNLGIAYSTVIENAVGGSGADTLLGNAAANSLSGGAGNDEIRGGDGNDSIEGGDGSNFLRGEDGDDSISGGSGFDDINGNKGQDTASGHLGTDWVVGGQGDDLLNGDEGDDIVYGNIGNDWCDGGVGADTLRGGQDNDMLLGQSGDDWLSGDRGSDTETGGAGADTFYIFGDSGVDRVTDFSRAQGDRVQLDPGTTYAIAQSGADTVITLSGGATLVLVGVQATSLTPGWVIGV